MINILLYLLISFIFFFALYIFNIMRVKKEQKYLSYKTLSNMGLICFCLALVWPLCLIYFAFVFTVIFIAYLLGIINDLDLE